MKFTIFLLTLLYVAAGAAASAISDSQVEDALRQLDLELTNRDRYIEERVAYLDSLKKAAPRQLPADSLACLNTLMEIARGYSAFNNDSALMYYTRGYDLSLGIARSQPSTRLGQQADSIQKNFRALRATYMSLSGFVHDAINEFNDIDTVGFTPAQRAVYFDAARQMYYYISSFYGLWPSTYDYWSNRTLEAQYQLMPLLDPGSNQYRLNLGEYYYKIREYTRAREVLLDLLSRTGRDTSHYAIATHILASIAQVRGDRNECIYYLAQSALSDIRNATLEVISIQELAGMLFEMGDKQRAHEYITAALSNVVASRASVRVVKTTELLQMVEADHNSQIAVWRTWMYAIISVLVMCMLALLLSMLFLRRQLSHVARMRKELQDANQTKEVYISQFMSLCSVYVDKLKQFGKLVNRKISAGQANDLLKLTKSGKFVEEQSADFYNVFDNAFLHIYPDFVEGVNRLLREGEQIVLEEGEVLNTDLRILAFMRLGINDTNRVAQILNFSVNTIYAYRNRLRNRAIDRDTFEADIMRIGSFDMPAE